MNEVTEFDLSLLFFFIDGRTRLVEGNSAGDITTAIQGISASAVMLHIRTEKGREILDEVRPVVEACLMFSKLPPEMQWLTIWEPGKGAT